jgi:hypothetical protein
LGSMVFDVKPLVFPPRKVWGEFVWKVFFAGLLTQLDAGAPYYSKFFHGWLGFDAEEETEQIPVGFDSKKCFAEVDEDGNVANGIRVEVMDLKPVIIKKATKEGTSGEGQSPFGKMEECVDFVDVLHGERFTERGAPVDKILFLEQPLGN